MITTKNMAIRSAQTVSALRAIAANETDPAVQCGDYLAKNFLTQEYKLLVQLIPHLLLRSFIHITAPGSYCFMIIRTKHFDQTLLKEINAGIRQVVLLGAGYDTRPLRFADVLKGISIFEVDYPGTQLYKKERLRKTSAVIPGNITFIPLDFNTDPLDKLLIANGFLPQLKTLFLWEGVSYYLPEAVVQQVLTFVSNCAAGSSILFDYATNDFVNGDDSTYGGKQVARWLKKIKEPFLFGMNAGDVSAFIRNCKLSVVSDYGPEEVEKMYLRTTKGRLLGKTLGHVRMVHAQVL